VALEVSALSAKSLLNLKHYSAGMHHSARSRVAIREKTVVGGRLKLPGMSVKQIAKKLNLNHKTVRTYLDEVRNPSAVAKERAKDIFSDFCNKNKGKIFAAHKEYLKGDNEEACAKVIGCNAKTVKKIFRHFGLRVKTVQELLKVRNEAIVSAAKRRKIDFEWLDLYERHKEGEAIYSIAQCVGISESVIGRRFKDLGLAAQRTYKSEGEKKITNFIKGLGFDCINNTRNIIKKENTYEELDVFVPSMSIAFEFNGVYTHSHLFKKRNYHRDKTEICLAQGISLIHVWEGYEFEKVFSRIRSKLGVLSERIYARKCEVVKDHKGAKLFLDINHYDGNVQHKFSYALVADGEIVSLISFRNNKGVLEIARYANKADTLVVGGFAKLLKASCVEAKKQGYKAIMTYADIDWTPNYKESVYFRNGFTYLGKTEPKMFFSKNGRLVSRQKYQKHKLKELFDDYRGQSVREFLASKNILTVYTTGNHKFWLDL
jgi:predicted transcriptional regulator